MKTALRLSTAAVVGGALVALSCSLQAVDPPSGVTPTAAAARIAELHVRFGLRTEVESSFVAAPGARAAHVVLPPRATDEVRVEDEGSRLTVSFSLDGAQDAPLQVPGGAAVYAGALAGADVVHVVRTEGTEDFVVFEERPAHEELVYVVDVSHVAGLRLVSNTVEFLDEGGAPRLRIAPPYVIDVHAKRHEARLAVEGCAHDTSPVGPWGRKVTAPGAAHCTVRVSWSGDVTYPAMVDPAWTTTGSMTETRVHHTATLLGSGKVLVAGGAGPSAELYDPVTGTFAATSSMGASRQSHSATALASGKVLIVGGEFCCISAPYGPELYDPATGTFGATGPMQGPRTGTSYHTASLLASGKVLIAGGNDLVTAEVYDPATGTFADTGPMRALRTQHTASVLPSGKVLITGGEVSSASGASFLPTAELYDPAAGTFQDTGPMSVGRALHTASVLHSGKVLIAGGEVADGPGNTGLTSTTELYDPATGTFSASGPMLVPAGRGEHTATVLASGAVLMVGGISGVSVAGGSGGDNPFPVAELYDPASGWFSASVSVASATYRYGHTATALPSGRVLVAGGQTNPGPVTTVELFNIADGSPCTSSLPSECASGICQDGICCTTACKSGSTCDATGACKLAAGQPCTENTECAGWCNVGTCASGSPKPPAERPAPSADDPSPIGGGSEGGCTVSSREQSDTPRPFWLGITAVVLFMRRRRQLQ